MEECGMKSSTPVTRQGWRWVLCGAGSAQRQDARLQRPGRHSPSCVFVWPSTSTVLCSRLLFVWTPATVPTTTTPVSAIRQMEPITITLRITCTWLAWLGGWVVLSES